MKFYARKEVKDVLCYLRLIANPADNLSLIRIINTPARKIGPRTIEIMQESADASPLSLWEVLQTPEKLAIPASKQEILAQFAADITALREQNQTEPVSAVIKAVLTRTKLKDYWSQEGT